MGGSCCLISEGTTRPDTIFYFAVEGKGDENETNRAQRCLSLQSSLWQRISSLNKWVPRSRSKLQVI